MTTIRCTEADFDRLGWHDCHVWGLDLHVGDPDEGDWTSDLVLDIDFITEWICDLGGAGRFRVAPATLAFHGVTDLRLGIDWGASGHRVALFPVSIDGIERAPVPEQTIFLDRPYYAWRIRLNSPRSGEIAFGAVGFTQVLRAAPVLADRQHLSWSHRRRPEAW